MPSRCQERRTPVCIIAVLFIYKNGDLSGNRFLCFHAWDYYSNEENQDPIMKKLKIMAIRPVFFVSESLQKIISP
jgi:hypothetical protein